MRKILPWLVIASVVTVPLEAHAAQSESSAVHTGAFVGARLHFSFGGRSSSKPRAALTLAPTQSRLSSSGMIRTTIGEGLAMNFSPKSKPTLTLAGVRADTALGLQRNGRVDTEGKLGISTGGWIAIGVGAVALAGAAIYVGRIVECEADPDDNCGSD